MAGKDQLPSTRMGNFAVQRAALVEAQDYMREWDDYNAKVKRGDKDAKPPKHDLKLEALADVLRGKLLVQIHCYRADELLTEMAMAKEFGYKVRAFHHALEAYKVADELAAQGVAIATFSDWWGYKQEAWDAIPWNAVISMRKGVRVAIKSDSEDFARRLNQEAAKTMRYGGATEEEALKMITINPAWIIGVDDRVGSIDVGKGCRPGDLGWLSALQFRRAQQSADRWRCLFRPLAAGIRHAALSGGRVMGDQSSVVGRQSSETVVGRWSLVVGQILLALAVCLPVRVSFRTAENCRAQGRKVAYGFAWHD